MRVWVAIVWRIGREDLPVDYRYGKFKKEIQAWRDYRISRDVTCGSLLTNKAGELQEWANNKGISKRVRNACKSFLDLYYDKLTPKK